MLKRTPIRAALVLLMLFVVAACARFALVDAQPQTVAGELTVQPTFQWNRLAMPWPGELRATEIWTIDGQGLQSLIFVVALEDGEPLFGTVGKPLDDVPRFRTSMTEDELAELFEASLTSYAGSNVFEFTSISPVSAFGTNGIRMEFSFAGSDSIDRDGVAIAAVRNDRFYLIAYQGTHLHYFEKYLPEVERILASATLKAEA